MSSTFFGLNIAFSGVNAAQAALNTTANNVSNVDTKGYTRQEAVQQAAESIRVYSSYGSAGAGVTTTGIQQIRDSYYDVKYWNNNQKLGEFETKAYYLDQIQTAFKDDTTTTGFNTIFDKVFSSLTNVQNNAADTSVRAEFIGQAQTLATYFNGQMETMQQLQEDCNEEINSRVAEINSIAQEIATINKQINVIEVAGGTALELRDQRASLVDQLSAIVPVTVKEDDVVDSLTGEASTGATYFQLKINGQSLVSGKEYNTLACTARESKVNESDIDGLYDVCWAGTGNSLNLNSKTMSGELKALFDLRDGNAGNNFQGTVSNVYKDKVTITNTNINDISKVTLNPSGTISLGKVDYNYTSYKMIDNGDGTYDYEFTMEKNMNSVSGKVLGTEAEVGESVDYYGIPYYCEQMTEFVRNFAKLFNDIHTQGVDLNGDDADIFFTGVNELDGTEYTGPMDELSYLNINASNFCVRKELQTDSTKMATINKKDYDTTLDAIENGESNSELVGDLLNLKSGVVMFRGTGASSFLQCVLSDVAIDTQNANTFKSNYKNISDTIENQRLSVSGVDEDEEALNLVKFQNAYNLSAKVISTMQELYDRLILQTGV